MTEGIIQVVFTKAFGRTASGYERDNLRQLEIELVAKIKAIVEQQRKGGFEYPDMIAVDEIIGDQNEI